MISFDEAQKVLEKHIQDMTRSWQETRRCQLPLEQAKGRVLSEPIVASINIPPFDNSAMDGYAVRSEETTARGVRLKLQGSSVAGSTNVSELNPRSVMRIMTGAPIPNGSDAVVKQEDVEVIEGGYVWIPKKIEKRNNVRSAGEDIVAGQTVLEAGHQCNPTSLSIVAACGFAHCTVFLPPTCAVLATGDEIVEPGESLQFGQIYNSNSSFLKASLQGLGIDHILRARVPDRLSETIEAIKRYEERSDVLIFTGGVSVGDHDYCRQALEECGYESLFWKVAQKPGKPIHVARKNQKMAFALPGNPYSVMVSFYFYVLPYLKSLLGHKEPHLKQVRAKLNGKVTQQFDRTTFLKAKLEGEGEDMSITPLWGQGSHQIFSLRDANVLLQLGPGEVSINEKDEVDGFYIPKL